MTNVVSVRFKKAGKVYYFDPGFLMLSKGMKVIVETARGLEVGVVAAEPGEVPPARIVSPLKKVVRIADGKDLERHEENAGKKTKAMAICQEKVRKHNLDMKLIDVEYTFDNTKIIFYFTSEGRVDFRELVKDLAGVFKMRIELRQIGVRDESKMMGGIGSCGKGLCCHTWMADFDPVSIKMAKVQNLSLNPTKISGVCGRLMCCLKYENDIYVELKKGMPEPGERIRTENGIAVVLDTSILRNQIKARVVLEEGKGDKPEKLSTEIYMYRKEDIERIQGHARKQQGKKEKAKEKESLEAMAREEGVCPGELKMLLEE